LVSRWLRYLLEDVARGEMSVEEALVRLKGSRCEDLGVARLDSHRTLQEGSPEVVFCPGKTEDQILRVVARIRACEGWVLAAQEAARAQSGESGRGGRAASEPGLGSLGS
jgi:NCAIR mutase (PurE)-related protein